MKKPILSAINITVDAKLKRELRIIAASNNRSLTEECREGLTMWAAKASRKKDK